LTFIDGVVTPPVFSRALFPLSAYSLRIEKRDLQMTNSVNRTLYRKKYSVHPNKQVWTLSCTCCLSPFNCWRIHRRTL